MYLYSCKICGNSYNKDYMRVKDCCPNCYMNRRHRETKEKLVAYLGGKCICCGYSKCMDALEFHHLDASKKEFSICNAKSKSIER